MEVTLYAGFDAIDKIFNSKQLKRHERERHLTKKYKIALTRAMMYGKDISDSDIEKHLLEEERIQYDPVLKDFC